MISAYPCGHDLDVSVDHDPLPCGEIQLGTHVRELIAEPLEAATTFGDLTLCLCNRLRAGQILLVSMTRIRLSMSPRVSSFSSEYTSLHMNVISMAVWRMMRSCDCGKRQGVRRSQPRARRARSADRLRRCHA